MAIGLIKDQTRVAIKQESAEGTYEVPTSATEYIQPLEDGFEITPSKDLIERQILTASIGQITPRPGMRGVAVAAPVEFRASGTEGEEPDFDLLLQGAIGQRRQQTSRTTTTTGHTTTQINLAGGTIGNFTVGDIIVILDTGDHTVHVVTEVDTTPTENITILPARSSPPADAVEITEFTTYFPANTGHPPLSVTSYWGNEIDERAIGCKVTSMSLDNFATGQIASLNFALEGLSFDEVDGASPQTPAFDSSLPPLILQACVFQDGVQIDLNTVSLTLTNTLGFITSTCDANGKISSRVTDRAITGTINPYKDDTSVAQHTRFDTNANFSLFLRAFNPSTTAGEITLGSVIGIFLPQCIITEKKVGETEGVLTDDLSFQVHSGDTGDTDEIFLGMV